MSDVEHALAQAQAENARLAASCAGLAVDARQAVSVSRDMQEQLQASAAEAHAASNASDSGGAVGAGVSQLNPELCVLGAGAWRVPQAVASGGTAAYLRGAAAGSWVAHHRVYVCVWRVDGSAELVARLRKENQELRGQVDTGTVARVEELANELEDAVALRDSFEKVGVPCCAPAPTWACDGGTEKRVVPHAAPCCTAGPVGHAFAAFPHR